MKDKKILYADQLADEEMLRNTRDVSDALRNLGIDDIFNADNSELIMMSDDEFFNRPVQEEQFEAEEEFFEPSLRQLDDTEIIHEPPQKILNIPITHQQGVPDNIQKLLIQSLNKLNESNILEISHTFQIHQNLNFAPTIIQFLLNFNQSQNLTATLAVFFYQLYIILNRENYNKILLNLIQFQLSTPHENLLEFFSFCSHFRCFPVEINVELLKSNTINTIMNNVRIFSVQIQSEKQVKKVLNMAEIAPKTEFFDVKMQILNDILCQKQRSSLFENSYLKTLENQLQEVKTTAVKSGQRLQCEYSYKNVTLANFMQNTTTNNIITIVPFQTQLLNDISNYQKQLISEAVLLSRFHTIFNQSKPHHYQAIFGTFFNTIQTSAYTPVFIQIMQELVLSAPSENAPRAFFWDFFIEINDKNSNSVAQIARLLGVLTVKSKLEKVINRGFERKRSGVSKKNQIFWDIVFLSILQQELSGLGEVEIRSLLKWEFVENEKIFSVVGGKFDWKVKREMVKKMLYGR